MSRRHFSGLLIAVVIVTAAIALLLPGQDGRDSDSEGQLLLPVVAPLINEVDRVIITGAGGLPVSTLVRKESHWAVAELHDYPADWRKLRGLLSDLARATIVETKTSNPQYYSRLGVEDINSENAGGLQLEILTPDQSASLIIGDNAGALGGQYVRHSGQAQSVLSDREIDLTAEPVDWVETTVVDIGSALVAEVEIMHHDGDRILVNKVSADDADFELVNLPAGREPASSWSLNSLASVFSLLRLEDVQPVSESMETEAASVRVLTFSGLEITARLFSVNDRFWLGFEASAASLSDGDLAEDDMEPGAGAVAEMQSRAEEINEQTRGWLFALPAGKIETMTRRLGDVLSPLEGEKGNDS
jgi:hypothetical protein